MSKDEHNYFPIENFLIVSGLCGLLVAPASETVRSIRISAEMDRQCPPLTSNAEFNRQEQQLFAPYPLPSEQRLALP